MFTRLITKERKKIGVIISEIELYRESPDKYRVELQEILEALEIAQDILKTIEKDLKDGT